MNNTGNIKALGLCSGGLDSILAGLVLKRQGIDVTWVTFETPFFDAEKSEKASEITGIPLIKKDITDIYLTMLKNPPLGYGKHMNPCRDCHSMMFQQAGAMMAEKGFDFLFSGEVAGQRPLSQTKQALRYVEKSSGFDGHIVRPLSAKVLPETDVENRGLVDREKLYDFSGRSRKPQIALAKEFGVSDYPSPAGGCLLTDKGYSGRLKDLFDHQENYTRAELELLKFGRHIRLNEDVKIIAGRTKYDNRSILNHYDPTSHLLLDVPGIGSPTVLVPAGADTESIRMAASICVSYTKTPAGEERDVIIKRNKETEKIVVSGISNEEIKTLMV